MPIASIEDLLYAQKKVTEAGEDMVNGVYDELPAMPTIQTPQLPAMSPIQTPPQLPIQTQHVTFQAQLSQPPLSPAKSEPSLPSTKPRPIYVYRNHFRRPETLVTPLITPLNIPVTTVHLANESNKGAVLAFSCLTMIFLSSIFVELTQFHCLELLEKDKPCSLHSGNSYCLFCIFELTMTFLMFIIMILSAFMLCLRYCHQQIDRRDRALIVRRLQT